MHHPASKIMNFLSVVVTTLCTAICLQEVTNRTRSSRVVLCSPGQEGHTVAVLKDHWRLFDRRRHAGVWCDDTSQLPVSFSFFVLTFLGVFPPCLCLCPSRLSHSCLIHTMFQSLSGRQTGWWWRKGGVGRVAFNMLLMVDVETHCHPVVEFNSVQPD